LQPGNYSLAAPPAYLLFSVRPLCIADDVVVGERACLFINQKSMLNKQGPQTHKHKPRRARVYFLFASNWALAEGRNAPKLARVHCQRSSGAENEKKAVCSTGQIQKFMNISSRVEVARVENCFKKLLLRRSQKLCVSVLCNAAALFLQLNCRAQGVALGLFRSAAKSTRWLPTIAPNFAPAPICKITPSVQHQK